MSLGILLYILFWIDSQIAKSGNISISAIAWYRLTLSIPLIFFAIFASIQYIKERNLLEKYAFKETTAIALQAYTKLLTDKFEEEKEKIITFVLDSIGTIYKEPYLDKDKNRRYNIGFMNKIFEVGFEELEQEVKEEVKKATIDKISKDVENSAK